MKVLIETSEISLKNVIEVADGYDFNAGLNDGVCIQKKEEGRLKYFYSTGLIFIDIEFQALKNTSCHFKSSNPFVLMVFHQDGNSIVKNHHKENKANYKRAITGHNLTVADGNTISFIYEEQTRTDLFVLMLSKDFFLRLMPKENNNCDKLFKAIETGQCMTLFREYASIGHEIKQVIEKVRKCGREGAFFRLCLEIKIAELLMLQLEQHELQHIKHKSKPQFHIADIKKLEQAKRVLEENYTNPPTIKSLAHIVGINETKLKDYFKKMFDNTIHEYITSLRMKKAYQLLTRQKLILKEVALKVGYQKTSNFTNVFKKYYGVHPKKVRRKS